MTRWMPGVFALLTLGSAVAQPLLPRQSTADEQARFLSGLRVPTGSMLEGFQKTPGYFEHGKTYAETWRGFHRKYFSPMRRWSAENVLPRVGRVGVLYYLFGGPDFINAYALFPNAPVYVLGGLEPVGSVMPPERLSADQALAGLANLRESTSVTLQFSHFITKDMKVDLEETEFKGVMPILYSFVALAGGQIVGSDYVGIDGGGQVVPLVSSTVPSGMVPGLRIVFRKDGGAAQTLYYVEADLSDGSFKLDGGLAHWMAGLGPGVSYLKAASYLMHESYFSTVRDFLLSNSTAILQDDSGIPLRDFLGADWQLAFFGSYTGTLELFDKYVQGDLLQAYRTPGGARDLPFGTGYKWKPGESNLMLAVRAPVAPRAVPVE